METSRFDDLAKMIGETTSRRTTLRAALGVVLALASVPMATKAKNGRKRRRRRGRRGGGTGGTGGAGGSGGGASNCVGNDCADPGQELPPTQPDLGASPCNPPCPVCQTCNGGVCVSDATQNRTVCSGTAPNTFVCCNGDCCGGCCREDGSCGACRVFITSTQHNGNLGGLSGADETCRTRALAGNLPGAAVVGNYKAWLSDSTASPFTRFRRSGQPYLLPRPVEGASIKVADHWNELTFCWEPGGPCLDHPINVTESGTTVADGSSVWTYTQYNGREGRTDHHCNNWQDANAGAPLIYGDYGRASVTTAPWTEDLSQFTPCASRDLRLYCFQQS